MLRDITNICKAIHAGSKSDMINRQAPVMLLHDILEPELCQELISYWEAGEKRADGVSKGTENSSTAKSGRASAASRSFTSKTSPSIS